MSYPNSALSGWQLAVMAVVAIAALAVWLTAVYLADRQPREQDRAAAGSPAEAAISGPGPDAAQELAVPAGQAAGAGDRAAA